MSRTAGVHHFAVAGNGIGRYPNNSTMSALESPAARVASAAAWTGSFAVFGHLPGGLVAYMDKI